MKKDKLKMNLQFFSEEGEGGESLEDTQNVEGIGVESGIDESKLDESDEVVGFTEEDVELKIAEERAKWLAELEEKERLSKLSQEEREKEEKIKNEKTIEELKQTILKNDLKEKATVDLTKSELPIELRELLDYSSKENMEKSLSISKEIVTKCVEKEVNKRLRGGTPAGITTNLQGSITSKAFKNMNYKERNRLYNEDIELYKKLKGQGE